MKVLILILSLVCLASGIVGLAGREGVVPPVLTAAGFTGLLFLVI